MALQARVRGSDKWYAPERDLLHITPSLVVRGASYAADPSSALYNWLVSTGACKGSAPRVVIERWLRKMLLVLYECRKANLEDVLDVPKDEWPVFQAIMCGVGIMATKMFTIYYKASRMHESGGVIIEPTDEVDVDGMIKAYNNLVDKAVDSNEA